MYSLPMLLQLFSMNEGGGGTGYSSSLSYSVKVCLNNRVVAQTWTQSSGLLTEISPWLLAALKQEVYEVIKSNNSEMFRSVSTMIIEKKKTTLIL